VHGDKSRRPRNGRQSSHMVSAQSQPTASSSNYHLDTSHAPPKLACPYYKYNPKYAKCRACSGPGWDNMSRLKSANSLPGHEGVYHDTDCHIESISTDVTHPLFGASAVELLSNPKANVRNMLKPRHVRRKTGRRAMKVSPKSRKRK
jgi:hypothetical protein